MDSKTLVVVVLVVGAVAVFFTLRSGGAGGPRVEAAEDAGDYAIVEYGKDSCLYCHKMKDLLEKINREVGGVLDIEYVSFDKEPDREQEARDAGMGRGVPFLVVYGPEDEVVLQQAGYGPAEAQKMQFVKIGLLRLKE